jgi:hypothetical protein
MSGSTVHGFPYVTPDDHPKEFPASSQALANKLESAVKVVATGTSSGNTGLAAAAGVAVNITFPVGTFTAPPMVVPTTNSARLTCGLTSVTAAGASIAVNNWSPAASPVFSVHWVAVGT